MHIISIIVFLVGIGFSMTLKAFVVKSSNRVMRCGDTFLYLVNSKYIPKFRKHGLSILGASTQSMEFRPEKDNDSFECTMFEAGIGEELSTVAEKANVPIAYQCRKGECGTCEVNMNGKWVRTCQTQVPAMPAGQDLLVVVKKVKKKPAKFFSPKSFAEGIFNNGLGVVGFVARGATSGKEFSERMDREKSVEELVAERKAAKDQEGAAS